MGAQGGMKRMQQGQGMDQRIWQQQDGVPDQRFFAQGMPMVGSGAGAGYMQGLEGMVGSGPGYMPGLDGMQPGMVMAGLHSLTPMQVLLPTA
jgi:hypothetical protein